MRAVDLASRERSTKYIILYTMHPRQTTTDHRRTVVAPGLGRPM